MSKPKPPQDLWQGLEAALKEADLYQPPRPDNSFTFEEFMQKFDLTEHPARQRLAKLRRLGRVDKVGQFGRLTYYTLKG